ncbi:MAG: hypothetical protein EPO06_03825 [Burkholderiaceae bacterium]|nr:MAG: hypothetical protein EPO06_03825 [Burkholderiaceae bacterium]
MLASNAMQRFVDYFGELGARWGLPSDACRVHAYLYIEARPTSEKTIAEALVLNELQLADALAFLVDFQMAERIQPSDWRTSDDPWDMLATGLEERRRRELSPALATLRDCHRDALRDKAANHVSAVQMWKMLALVENLAALDKQMQRLSPQLLRGIVDTSTRVARFADRVLGMTKGGRP